MRYKQFAYRTEQSYVDWIRRFTSDVQHAIATPAKTAPVAMRLFISHPNAMCRAAVRARLPMAQGLASFRIDSGQGRCALVTPGAQVLLLHSSHANNIP